MKQETWLPFLAFAFTFFLLLEKSLKTRSVCRFGVFQALRTSVNRLHGWIGLAQNRKQSLKIPEEPGRK